MASLNMEYMIESTVNNLDLLEWFETDHDQIQSLYSYAYDDIILERVKLEKFYRNNRLMIDNLTESIIKQQGDVLINEGIMKDLGVDLGIMAGTSAKVLSAVPLLGQAVAAGGTIYYIVRAINAWRKGEKLTSFFETLSAAMTAGTVIGPVGAALSALGNLVLKPFKAFFGLFKAEGLIGKFFANFFKKGPQAEKIVAETAETIAKAPGAGKAADGAMKFSDKIDDIVKFFETPAGKEIASKIPGFEIYLNLLQKLKTMLGFFGKFTKSAIKSEGKAAAEISEELSKHSDDAIKLAEEVGDDALANAIKEAEVVKGKLKGATKAARDSSKTARAAKTAATKADDAAKAAKATSEAIKKDLELTAELIKKGEYVDPSLVNNVSRMALGSTDEIAKVAADDIVKAFSNASANEIKRAFFPNKQAINALKSQLKKAGALSEDLIKLTGDEFAEAFTRQFLSGSGEIALKGVTSDAAGRLTFQVVGANGAILKATPAKLFNMLKPDDAAKLLHKTLGSTIEKGLKETAEELTKKALESKAVRDHIRKNATGLASKLKGLKSEISEISSKIMTEVTEEVSEKAIPELAEAVVEGGTKNSSKVMTSMMNFISARFYNRVVTYISEQLEMSDFEEIESGDQDYLRTDAERNNQSSDTEIISPSRGGSGTGLRENYMLEDIIMYSRINSSRIRSQKLINLIN